MISSKMNRHSKAKHAKGTLSSFVITTLLLLVLLLQGGFGFLAWCASGIVIAILLALGMPELPPRRLIISLVLLPIGYLISTLTTGMNMEGWMGLLRITVVVLFVFVPRKPKPEQICLYAGLLVAGIGLLGFGGWLPLPGMTVAGRLLSVFQYANAAAIFLAACAFITRLTDKPEWAVLMEVALILTQSIGGLGVYFLGWIFYTLVSKEKISHHFCGFIFSGILAALILALMRFTPVYWLSPLICIAYIIFRKQIFKASLKVANAKWLAAFATLSMVAFAVGLFALRGIRPLLTYLERIIHMTDGVNVMLRYPLGFGSGNWALHHMEYQSANYNASHIHSSFIQIGVDGGIFALAGFLSLIFVWIYRQKINVYSIAAMMILFHAMQDFTLSFLSIAMLLVILMCAAISPQSKNKSQPNFETQIQGRAKAVKLLVAVPLAFCFILFLITEAEKNQARWQAQGGNFPSALHQLENRLIFPDDMESTILRLVYSLQIEDFDAFRRASGDISRHNADSSFLISEYYYRQGDIELAVSWMLYSTLKSPHQTFGYSQIEQMLSSLPPARQNEIREQVSSIRENAAQNAHLLSSVLHTE